MLRDHNRKKEVEWLYESEIIEECRETVFARHECAHKLIRLVQIQDSQNLSVDGRGIQKFSFQSEKYLQLTSDGR